MKMLNRERVEELVLKQDSLNKITAGEDWATKGFDWRLYGIMEAAEAIESLPYKHWKKGEADFDNIKVEVIDILHFMLSDSLTQYDVEDIVNIVTVAQIIPDDVFFAVNNSTNLIGALKELIADLSTPSVEDYEDELTYSRIFILWQTLGETPESLYKAYMTKNLLNAFRQANGYREGTYIKTWVHKGELVEDNVVAFDLASELDISEDFAVSLKAALKDKYKDAFDGALEKEKISLELADGN